MGPCFRTELGMVSSDMASSSREAAMDDARREPTEQDERGLSNRDGVPHTIGSKSRDYSAPRRETGHPKSGQGGCQAAHRATRKGTPCTLPHGWGKELSKGPLGSESISRSLSLKKTIIHFYHCL